MAKYERLHETEEDAVEKLLPNAADESGQLEDAHPRRPCQQRVRRLSTLLHFAAEAILIAALLFVILRKGDNTTCYHSQLNYTPAGEAIEYVTQPFNGGYVQGEKSRYQLDCFDCEPTDAIDAAWEELYEGIMWSKIPRHQAAQLRNLTINIPGNEDHYLIGLDVFHQLHCLDNLRKSQWPDRYRPEDHMGGQGMSMLSVKHLDHCIDQIRQSIMCQSDLTPNWLYWDERFGAHMAARDMEHSCRSFDRVHEWARQRKQEPFDLSVRVYDPLKAGGA